MLIMASGTDQNDAISMLDSDNGRVRISSRLIAQFEYFDYSVPYGANV